MRTLETAAKTGFDAVQLWCLPTTDHAFFHECTQHFDITLHTQLGTDLGERMAHAIAATLHHSRHVILIGTDCPSLTSETLNGAAKLLDQGVEAVIAPALDGGYVLLGVSQPCPELFASIDWGSDAVMQSTRERLRMLGWKWHELAAHRDIDRAEDLDSLPVKRSFPTLPIKMDR